MICNKCSQTNNDNQVFCVHCGYVINDNYQRTNIAELANTKKYEKGNESIYGYISLFIAILSLANQMFFYKNIVIGCALGFIIWWLSEKGQDDLETISKIAKVLAIILIILSIFQQVMMIANYI